MQHSLWWLFGQFCIVALGGAAIIAAVIAVWYGLSFLVLMTVGRVFPLRGRKWTPADYDPSGGAAWRVRSRWSMTLEEVRQAKARLRTQDRRARDRACEEQGHAWAACDTGTPHQYCGRCFAIRQADPSTHVE